MPKANGISILPPDVNLGLPLPPGGREDGASLRPGRHQGQQRVGDRIHPRGARGSPFTSLFDFASRVDKRLVNRRTMESIARRRRPSTLRSRPRRGVRLGGPSPWSGRADRRAHRPGEPVRRRTTAILRDPELLTNLRWTERDRLLNEKRALGLPLRATCFDAFAPEVRRMVRPRSPRCSARDATGGPAGDASARR